MFEGQAAVKTLLWLVLPSMVFVFLIALLTMARASQESSWWERLVLLYFAATATQASSEFHSLRRLLRHFNGTALGSIGFGICLVILYAVATAVYTEHYSCTMWSTNATPLAVRLVNEHYEIGQQPELLVHWLFMGFACGFSVFCIYCFGSKSKFASDRHWLAAQRIFNGMQVLSHLQHCSLPLYKVSRISRTAPA